MKKYYQILQLINRICGTSLMKCHDISYATVKKESGLDTKHFSQQLNHLKELRLLQRLNGGWKLTSAGEMELKRNKCFKANDISKNEILKNISADLHALLRCGIRPTKKWMADVAAQIDSCLYKNS